MTTIEEFAADAQEDYKAVGCVSYLTVGKYLETILEYFDSLQDYLPPEVMNSAIEQLQNTDRTYNDRVTQWAIERKKEFERYLEEEKHTVERLQGGDKKTPTALDKGKTRPVKAPLVLSAASNVEIKEPEWLIPGYIPRYGITTLAADGGTGKSFVLCDLAAAVTTGRWPFFFQGYDFLEGMKPEKVLFFSAEDSWEYVLGKRLQDSGANLELIKYLSPADPNFINLNLNGELLEEILSQEMPGLVMFDPIQSFIPENVRMGERNAMRKCVTPLIGYGEKYKTTFIIVAHTNKQGGVYGRKRIADSADIWDSSRSVLMLGETPEKDVRYLTHEKSNWGRLEKTALYTLENGIPVFKTYTGKKDRDYIVAASTENRYAPALKEAKEFIMDTLREQKQMEVSELDELATACGTSKKTLRNAKEELKKEKEIHIWSVGNNHTGKKYMISLTATDKRTSKE